ncbi:uncharacterized protein LOC106643609 [Copidosoma floridanum]|uniref:uncharacterized protein LOC106643609 n=1 Tax=Copidosoma floridanum TaxID=29053 RepID=UPI0006C940C6|nr:uncharacterized protein LOC106643609 [Copidosoma floridanum]
MGANHILGQVNRNNIKPKPAREVVGKNNLTGKNRKPLGLSVHLVHKKKATSPKAIAGSSPYTNVTRFNPPDTAKPPVISAIDQRVSSAKMLRIKQLQNQLADAHFHLNELSNENKLLKAIEKRQDAALKRYEGTKAELPRIINTHQEDYRVLQAKCKKLRSQCNALADTLKEKENELYSLQAQNKKLLQLSKDRHLLERDKLQVQVSDLNYRVDQQDEIIQMLKRKLALESKYLKHQLHVEMVKHKETQKQLHETQMKLKSAEELAEQRERQSYHASHVFFHKSSSSRPTSNFTSQSLTNLHDNDKLESAPRVQRRRRYEGTKGQSLPALGAGSASLTRRSQSQENPRKSTMIHTNNDRARNPQLLKSPSAKHKTAASISSKSSTTIRDSPIKESRLEVDYAGADGETPELPKVVVKEDFGYHESGGGGKVNFSGQYEYGSDPLSLTSRSRSLHTRLISSAVEGKRVRGELPMTTASRPRSFSKENMELMERLNESDYATKYDRDSVVTVISKDYGLGNETEGNNSHSDDESEIEIPVAFNADEDEDNRGKRQSDIDKSEIERHHQNKLSTDYSSSTSYEQFSRSSSSSSGPRESSKDASKNLDRHQETDFNSFGEIETKSAMDVDASIDDLISRKKSIHKETSPLIANLDANDYESALAEEEKLVANDLNGALSLDLKNSEEPNTAASDESARSFDKAKLLAAMKAIDDNENVEFFQQKPRKSNNAAARLQVTENLYRGIPTHSKKKSDIMKELFSESGQ